MIVWSVTDSFEVMRLTTQTTSCSSYHFRCTQLSWRSFILCALPVLSSIRQTCSFKVAFQRHTGRLLRSSIEYTPALQSNASASIIVDGIFVLLYQWFEGKVTQHPKPPETCSLEKMAGGDNDEPTWKKWIPFRSQASTHIRSLRIHF